MKLSSKDINEIAQELETGMKVYLNRETLEFRSVLDWDDMYNTDNSEYWDEEVRKIEKEWKDYIVITKMETREAFRVMENFVSVVDDAKLQGDLIKILNRKSPFANFKDEIDSSDYRQKWFDFKAKSYEDYVREQLDYEDIEHE
jgi:hypothetical protein